MSQIVGRLTTCSVCKTTIFSKAINENTFLNGGYRCKDEMFEDLPKGWVHNDMAILGESLPVQDLCPDCRRRIVEAMKYEINAIINATKEVEAS